MTGEATHVRATLDAWREQGADRLDPVRFHRIDALERRAAALEGDARALLDARLATLLEGFAEVVARADERQPQPQAARQVRPHAVRWRNSWSGSRAMRRPTGAPIPSWSTTSARCGRRSARNSSTASRSTRCRATPGRSIRTASCTGRSRRCASCRRLICSSSCRMSTRSRGSRISPAAARSREGSAAREGDQAGEEGDAREGAVTNAGCYRPGSASWMAARSACNASASADANGGCAAIPPHRVGSRGSAA